MIAAVSAIATLALGGAHAHAGVRTGGAVAQVKGNQVLLADGRIKQSWSVGARGQVTVSGVTDVTTGKQLATPGAPEFSLLLDSAPTSSTLGWRLIGAEARWAPDDAVRFVVEVSALQRWSDAKG